MPALDRAPHVVGRHAVVVLGVSGIFQQVTAGAHRQEIGLADEPVVLAVDLARSSRTRRAGHHHVHVGVALTQFGEDRVFPGTGGG